MLRTIHKDKKSCVQFCLSWVTQELFENITPPINPLKRAIVAPGETHCRVLISPTDLPIQIILKYLRRLLGFFVDD